MLSLHQITNPVYRRADNVRDPAVLPLGNGYVLFYSRHSNLDWGPSENWAIASAYTEDFVTFSDDRDITPKGYASPGDAVFWHGRYVLVFQKYPGYAKLCYSESSDAVNWTRPRPYLEEVLKLPWNEFERAIDPTQVIDGDTLHCFFVGSCARKTRKGHANLLGHAVTRDPALKTWEILTVDKPLMGYDRIEDGGIENVTVFRAGGQWVMISSEDLGPSQHLAVSTSPDLITWQRRSAIKLPPQKWMARSQGAPYVWQEGDAYWMILMGVDEKDKTSAGLLYSADGFNWTLAKEGSL
ncbi:MAG: hypothetical protein LLG01_08455 [Planctomycetaceae bacterium]|nr:hypothetical protein [Planctomycetaceae bacterium]